VDDVVLVDGPDTISLKNEVENLVVMLSSTKASVEGATAIVDAAVKENLNSVRKNHSHFELTCTRVPLASEHQDDFVFSFGSFLPCVDSTFINARP
jgi:hypothetical protein